MRASAATRSTPYCSSWLRTSSRASTASMRARVASRSRDVTYSCVLMTPADAPLCSDAATSDVASTATSELRFQLRMKSLPVRSSRNTSRGSPAALVLGPPGHELVEVDEPIVVGVDVPEANLDLAAGHFRIELVEHRRKFIDLDASVAIPIVVVERFAQLVELFFGRSVLRHF